MNILAVVFQHEARHTRHKNKIEPYLVLNPYTGWPEKNGTVDPVDFSRTLL